MTGECGWWRLALVVGLGGAACGPEPQHTLVTLELSHGPRPTVNLAVVDTGFLAEAPTPVVGRGFRRSDFAPADSQDGIWAMAAERFWTEMSLSPGECVQVHGLCITVLGAYPESFEEPEGTDLWVTVNVPELAERAAADRRRQDSVLARAHALCEGPPAPASPAPVTGPILLAFKPAEDIPSFPSYSDSNSAWKVEDAITEGEPEPVNPRRLRFAQIRPAAVACITGSRRAVPGRTISDLARRGPPRPVYTVEWEVRVKDWDTGGLVATRTFRATPEFKSFGGESRKYGLDFGTSEEFGDPSGAALAWLTSLIGASP
jgi:hypothetical protein